MGQGKLVRDMIPQIIRSKGLQPITYVADADKYAARLQDKLAEEVDEFIASDDDPEELADILEVLYALAEHAGTSREQLERLRRRSEGLTPTGSSGAGTAHSRSNLAVWPILPTIWS